MSEAVNGEARTGVAVLCSRVERIDREMTDNDEAHKAIYARLERLEIAIVQLQTRVAMWAAIGAALAGIAVQVAFKVW